MDIIQYLPNELNNIIKEYLKYSLSDRSLDFRQFIEYENIDSIDIIQEISDMYVLSYDYLKYKRNNKTGGFFYLQMVIYNSITFFKVKEIENEDEIRKFIIKYDKYNITKLKDGLDIEY